MKTHICVYKVTYNSTFGNKTDNCAVKVNPRLLMSEIKS